MMSEFLKQPDVFIKSNEKVSDPMASLGLWTFWKEFMCIKIPSWRDVFRVVIGVVILSAILGFIIFWMDFVISWACLYLFSV
jgi:preprotein translocase subunit SecE